MMNLYTKQNNTPSELPVVGATPNLAKPNLGKYVDPTGEFSSKQFNYSLWYVRHRVGLYRFLITILAVIGAALWAYSLWQWGDYFIFGFASDVVLERQASQSVNYHPLEQHFAAVPLQILSTDIFPGGVDKYDAVSEVGNSNEHFLAHGTFYYIIDGEKTAPKPFFILPGETSLLAELGVKSSASPGSAELVIGTMLWERISAHQVTDPKSWQSARLNFSLDDFVFTPLVSAGGVKANVMTFDLINQSPFGYVAPHFYVGLYQQDVMVGVASLSMDALASLEIKKIDLRNFVNSLAVSSAKLFPLINVYDPAVYLPLAK